MSNDTTNNFRHEGWKILGIEFAPLMIPIERRLQTAAILIYSCMFAIFPFIFMMIMVVLLFTPLFWLSLGYAGWMFYDIFVQQTSSRGGRRIQAVRHLKIWEYFCAYFPISLVKTHDLDVTNNYLFGYHPHGVIGCGAVGNFATEATGFGKLFPNIVPHLMTLKINFKFPVTRGFLLWSGVVDVSKESIRWVLSKKGTGNAAIIVVGGAQEALEAHPGKYNITLLNRKGFVKIAIKTGAHLVPVYSFGENDLFYQVDNPQGSRLRTFQEAFKNTFGFSPPLFHGRGIFNYTFGPMPFRKPIVTVVGKPIPVEKCGQPDQEMIDRIHQIYLQELSDLFDAHKSKYGVPESAKLNYV